VSRQLRGSRLVEHLRSVIQTQFKEAKSKGQSYKYVAKRVAEEANCSRTTLLKHAIEIESILSELDADKRTRYGSVKTKALEDRVSTLEKTLSEKNLLISGLRAERLELYDRMLRQGVDVGSLFREHQVETSEN